MIGTEGIILGIDPGLSGALAFYWHERKSPIWQIHDMPIASGELEAHTLYRLVNGINPDFAFLEHATAMPSLGRKMGAASMFRYGGLFYSIKVILACCDIPVTLVAPARWKRFYGLSGKDKERSRRLAIDLFPDQSSSLSRKKDHGRAEAMLIAYYGASKL